MRISLLILIATCGLVTSGSVAAADSATALAQSGPTQSSQAAIWTQRRLLNYPATSDCDALVGSLTFILVRLGAHDLQFDERGCLGGQGFPSVDATFFVLVPADSSDARTAAGTVDAHWQTTEIIANDADCLAFTKILPLFSTRNVKLFSSRLCKQYPVGLRAQVLKPAQPAADARQ